jgi:hypothetical protein
VQFNMPTRTIDELGRVTLYEIDGSGNAWKLAWKLGPPNF